MGLLDVLHTNMMALPYTAFKGGQGVSDMLNDPGVPRQTAALPDSTQALISGQSQRALRPDSAYYADAMQGTDTHPDMLAAQARNDQDTQALGGDASHLVGDALTKRSERLYGQDLNALQRKTAAQVPMKRFGALQSSTKNLNTQASVAMGNQMRIHQQLVDAESARNAALGSLIGGVASVGGAAIGGAGGAAAGGAASSSLASPEPAPASGTSSGGSFNLGSNYNSGNYWGRNPYSGS